MALQFFTIILSFTIISGSLFSHLSFEQITHIIYLVNDHANVFILVATIGSFPPSIHLLITLEYIHTTSSPNQNFHSIY